MKSRTLPLRRRLLPTVTATLFLAVAAALSSCAAGSRFIYPAAVPESIEIKAHELILQAADHEALYTLAGGLKPMSSGFWRGSFTIEAPDLEEMKDIRAALAPLRNEIWYADVLVFDEVHDGERHASAYVIHREGLIRAIERFEAFWSSWGITPLTHPAEVVAVVERMPEADRWRGYGYLYGYPADAVDFFVEAGLADKDPNEVGPGKDRQFMQIPTHAAATGRFTYAVPLDHERTAGDNALAEEARRILTAYRERSARMKDAQTAIALLRELNSMFVSRTADAARSRDTRYVQPAEELTAGAP